MKVNVNEIKESKLYLLANNEDIYEDEYDYLENLHTEEYSGIKDNLEEWENQMIEENCEWLTGGEIIRRLKWS